MNWARRLRWQVAVPVFAALAALAAAALPAAAQAAGPSGPGTGPTVPIFKGIPGRTAGPAALQQAPVPPLAGATPAVMSFGDPTNVLAYTGSDKHVYGGRMDSPDLFGSVGGSLVGGPGLTWLNIPGGGSALFGRGTNNALYVDASPWKSLGGVLTSRPGATAGALSVSGGEAIDTVVRGTDGAVWDREETLPAGGPLILPAAVKPWRSLGGQTLAGSGPAAVNVGGTLYVLALGTDAHVWVNKSTDGAHWSGWHSLWGRASGDVGAASPAPGVGIVFVRGADNAVWYNEFAGTTPGVSRGWHSLGGSLTSGVGAGSSSWALRLTSVVALGPDGHIIQRTGTWPTLSGWAEVF
jgi:hypothetical protein